MIKWFTMTLVAWAVCACCRPEAEGGQSFPLANISISEVASMASKGYQIIEQDLTIVGRVASSDSTGNFYRRVVIVDPSGGAELLSGFYENFLFMPEGTPLAVRLQGLAVDTDGGVLRVGLPADQGSLRVPQYFVSAVLWRRAVTMSDNRVTVQPVPYNPGGEFAHLLGQLVQVEDMSLADKGVTWNGIRLFCTSAGDSLWVETSSYATFAHDTIPRTPLTLKGILYRRNSRPRLVMNSQLGL